MFCNYLCGKGIKMRSGKSLARKLFFVPLFIFLTLLTKFNIHANPSNPFPQEITQADGQTVITLAGRGDEFFSWVEDENGYVVAFDEFSGDWHYAYLEDGQILPGGEIVMPDEFDPSDRPDRITVEDLKPLIDEVDFTRDTWELSSRLPPDRTNPRRERSPINEDMQEVQTFALANNNPTLLVMLIEYNDVQMVNTINYWYNHFFSTASGANSVNKYFAEASAGKFSYKTVPFLINGSITTGLPAGVSQIQLDNGVARVRLSKNYPPYGTGNNDAIGTDINTAFDAVKGYINFTPYGGDLYGGYILGSDFTVATVMAGWERSNTPANDGYPQRVHAHARSYSISGNIISVRFSDKSLYSYYTQGEIYSGSGASAVPMGIGVSVHELGHTLGLPDLYDTTSASAGVGPYSIMASGSWGAAASSSTIPNGTTNGHAPVQFDAWSKVELGFVTPQVVASTGYANVNMNSIGASSAYNVVKVTSTANPNQYFLVENRGLNGYDVGLERFGIRPAYGNNGGIMVWHIDESVKDSSGRLTNTNRLHRGVDAEEADGSSVLENPSSYSNQYMWFNHFFSNSPYTRYVAGIVAPLNGYGGGSGTFNQFSVSTSPNSNFHNGTNSQNVASGIKIKVNSARGTVMAVEFGDPPPTLAFTNSASYNIPASTVGMAIISINVSGGVSGGTTPYTFSATGLPAGITISAAGVISGTPTTAGAAGSATITVTDNAGAKASITITVGARSSAPTPTTYTVTYSLNSGSGTIPTETPKVAGATFAAAAITGITAPAGMQFKAWNTASNGSGTSYAPGATVTMPAGNLTLYAIWETIPVTTYTVTYNLNGGSGTTPTEAAKTAGATFAAAAITGITAPAGMQFKTWNTASNESGTSYAPGATVTMPANNLTLYAIWEEAYISVNNILIEPDAISLGDMPYLIHGYVFPSYATKQEIIWSVVNAGGTGATFNGNYLTATSTGTVKVLATIKQGISYAQDFTKEFDIVIQ